VKVGVCRDEKDKLCPIKVAKEGKCGGTECEMWHSDENPSNLTLCTRECPNPKNPTEDNITCVKECLKNKTWDVTKFTDVSVQMIFAMHDCDRTLKLKFLPDMAEFTTWEDFDCKSILIDLADHLKTIAARRDFTVTDTCIRPSSALFSGNYLKCRSEQEESRLFQENALFVYTFMWSKTMDLWANRGQFFLNDRKEICVPVEKVLEKAREYLNEELSAWSKLPSGAEGPPMSFGETVKSLLFKFGVASPPQQ
jgi:hypothetical protein